MRRTNYLKLSVSVVLVLTVYSVLLLALVHLESGEPRSTIKNFEDAVWFLMATLTTVGYGDATPASLGGRGIGVFFSIIQFGFVWIYYWQNRKFYEYPKRGKAIGPERH